MLYSLLASYMFIVSCFTSRGQYLPSYLWMLFIIPLKLYSSHCRFTILSSFIPFTCFLIFPWWIPSDGSWLSNLIFESVAENLIGILCTGVISVRSRLHFWSTGLAVDLFGGQDNTLLSVLEVIFLLQVTYSREKFYCFFEYINLLGLSWGRLKFHSSLCA